MDGMINNAVDQFNISTYGGWQSDTRKVTKSHTGQNIGEHDIQKPPSTNLLMEKAMEGDIQLPPSAKQLPSSSDRPIVKAEEDEI